MNAFALLEFAVFLLVVVLLVKPVGAYLERVFAHRANFQRGHRLLQCDA